MNSSRTGSRLRAHSNQSRREIESRSRSNSCRKARRLGVMEDLRGPPGIPAVWLSQPVGGVDVDIGWTRSPGVGACPPPPFTPPPRGYPSGSTPDPLQTERVSRLDRHP